MFTNNTAVKTSKYLNKIHINCFNSRNKGDFYYYLVFEFKIFIFTWKVDYLIYNNASDSYSRMKFEKITDAKDYAKKLWMLNFNSWESSNYVSHSTFYE